MIHQFVYVVFKYLLLNFNQNFNDLAKYAVAGGNVEIIRLCDQNHFNFNDTLYIALSFRRNDIAQWIIENNKDENHTSMTSILDYCIRVCNLVKINRSKKKLFTNIFYWQMNIFIF